MSFCFPWKLSLWEIALKPEEIVGTDSQMDLVANAHFQLKVNFLIGYSNVKAPFLIL